jgi:SAM-dependent methyltransferase
MKGRQSCPICAGTTEVLFSCPFAEPRLRCFLNRPGGETLAADQDYRIRRCASCELCFQEWVLEDDEAARWYAANPATTDYEREIGAQKLHWFAHMIEEVLVLRQVLTASPPAVLDFGSNWGKWASAALALGCRVDAVEINPSAAAFCARRGIRLTTLAELRQEAYDFINVDQVAEHLSDPLSVVRRLAFSLKPGGIMKLSTPDNARLPGLLARAQQTGELSVLDPAVLDPLAPLEHVNLFNHRSLKRLAAAAGLDPFRIPLLLSLGAGQLWNLPRQLNRNLVTPFKRWLGRRSYQWFRKPRSPELPTSAR